MAEQNEERSQNSISPIIRGFMHVALLRRLAMLRDDAPAREEEVKRFLAIRDELEARSYIRTVRIEARVEDLRDMAARRAARRRRTGDTRSPE